MTQLLNHKCSNGGFQIFFISSRAIYAKVVCPGCVCQEWATMLPSSVQSLSESCLFIPCAFSIPPSFDQLLNQDCAVVWRRSNRFSYTDVFNSRFTRDQSDRADFLQGNLLGDLLEKNCSTLLEDVSSNYAGSYFLRLECDNSLKFNFVNFLVEWQIQDSAPQPSIAPSTVEATEGTALDLECRAPILCPTLPPVLTWTPRLGEVAEADAQSVMTLTANHRHDDVRVTCSAFYRRQAGYSGISTNRGLTLRVLYGPKYTNVSYDGPALADTWLTLTCQSNANPPPDYTWYQAVDGQVTQVSSWSRYTLKLMEEDPTLVCRARNAHGEQNSSVTVQVQFAPRDTSVTLEPLGPILEGNPALLQCNSRAKPPVHHFNWSKDGIELSEFGDLLILNPARPENGGSYRCIAQNALGTETSAAILLDVQYPPKNTSVSTWPPGALHDGSEVTLRCNGEANPAIEKVQWYRVNAGVTTPMDSGPEVSFLVAKLSGDTFYCENRNIHGVQLATPIAINVTFAPEILNSSRCQDVSTGTRCFCLSHGNPPPNLQWESSKVLVNHSNQRPITVQDLDQVTRRSIILLKSPDDGVDSLVCVSLNQFGSVRLAFNISLPAPQTNVTVLVSSAVGLLVLLILSLLLLVYICRKTQINSQAVRRASFLGANKGNGSQAAILAPEAAAATDGEELHYANVHVAKTRGRQSGEIRGLSSVTQEYAEIRLRSTGEMERGREPEPGAKMAADAKAEPEEEMMKDSMEPGPVIDH
ncbi:myelin-associated glycoprotein-like [Stigmatopora nigra]